MSWSSMSEEQKLEYLVDRCELATNYRINDGSPVHKYEVDEAVWDTLSTWQKLEWYLEWCRSNPNIIEYFVSPDALRWANGYWN